MDTLLTSQLLNIIYFYFGCPSMCAGSWQYTNLSLKTMHLKSLFVQRVPRTFGLLVFSEFSFLWTFAVSVAFCVVIRGAVSLCLPDS